MKPFRTALLALVFILTSVAASQSPLRNPAVQALSKRFDVLQDQKTISFKKTLAVFGSLTSVPITIDASTLRPDQNLADVEGHPVRLPKLNAVLLAPILTHVTKQVGGSFRIRGNQLVVVFDQPGANSFTDTTTPLGVKLEALVRKQLAKKINVKKMGDVSLDRAVYALAYQNQLNVLVDVEAFARKGKQDVLNTSVNIAPMNNVVLSSALGNVLDQARATYRLRDFVVWIEPKE